MFKNLKLSMIGALMFVGLIGGVVGATIPTGTAHATCGGGFLGIPAWYQGMTDGNCNIKSPPRDEQGLTVYIWQIALNIVDIVLRVIGYIAVAFVVYGGFIYMTSNGSPDRAARGLKTIINAAVGVALAISAVAIKALLWTIMVGTSTNSYGVYQVEAVSVVSAAFNVAYTIAGAVAVIVIIMSGISYITSNGNAGNIAKAKQSLLYAVIGLIVVIIATPLTQFIIGRL